jgi:hypothetical protein
MQVQSAQTPSANPQKSAYADLMGGRYGGDGQGSGSTYYNFLRARVQQSQAITGGGQGMQASQNPPSSMI